MDVRTRGYFVFGTLAATAAFTQACNALPGILAALGTQPRAVMSPMPAPSNSPTVAPPPLPTASPGVSWSPPPSPTPGPYLFPADAQLTGRFTFGGNSPPQYLTAYFKPVGGSRSFETAQTDQGGYFHFKGVAPGSYQLIWDDGGENVTSADVNTAGMYVSDPVTSPPGDRSVPQATLDLKWEPHMVPAPGFSGPRSQAAPFIFNPIPNLDATYRITIFNSAKSAQLAATGSSSPIVVNVTSLAAGDYYYQIAFYRRGGAFGGPNFYGSTKYISFRLQ